MVNKQEVVRETREALLRARTTQEAELAETRGYALNIGFGAGLAGAASLGELGNLFSYWRGLSEDRFGDLSATGFAVTLGFSIASFAALAFAVHAGLNWMRGRDENPPFVSVSIGLLSLALSIAFPIYQTGGTEDGLIMRCLFSLLLTVVAGLALHFVMTGFDHKNRHKAAGDAILSIDDGIDAFAREKNLEGSRARRMGDLEAELKESFAVAFVQAHDDSLDALTLAVDSEGLPVAPIEGRIRNLLVGRTVGPQVAELIELTAGTTAIGLHRRLAGRSMSTAEASAVRHFLEVVRRPTQADVLRTLNSQEV